MTNQAAQAIAVKEDVNQTSLPKKNKGGRKRGFKSAHLSNAKRVTLNEMCYNYLIMNFSKFKQRDKIHVALEIHKRTMPSKVDMPATEVHHHQTTINLSEKTSEELISALMGRNGQIRTS